VPGIPRDTFPRASARFLSLVVAKEISRIYTSLFCRHQMENANCTTTILVFQSGESDEEDRASMEENNVEDSTLAAVPDTDADPETLEKLRRQVRIQFN